MQLNTVDLDQYIKDIVKREKIIWKKDQKISRMKRGAKEHHRELKKENRVNEREIEKKNQEIKNLEKEITTLKIGILHREEILQRVCEINSDQDVEQYLKGAWYPMTEQEKKDLI